jgi:hypothetical protein
MTRPMSHFTLCIFLGFPSPTSYETGASSLRNYACKIFSIRGASRLIYR